MLNSPKKQCEPSQEAKDLKKKKRKKHKGQIPQEERFELIGYQNHKLKQSDLSVQNCRTAESFRDNHLI
jgi:hypothetical protein